MKLQDLPIRKDVKGGAPSYGDAESSVKLNGGWFKSPVFTLLVGQAIAFVCWAILGAMGWGQLKQEFKEQAAWREDMKVWRKQIDSEGTYNFKYGRYEERLRAVEDSNRKLDTLVQSVSRLDETLKYMRDRKP